MVRWIATTTLLALLLTVSSGQAAEPTVISLSCSGTVKGSRADGTLEPEEPAKILLVVNLADRTVFGGDEFIGVVAYIDDATDPVTISFVGGEAVRAGRGYFVHISGTINRVTGAATLTEVIVPKDKETIVWTYNLACKITSHLF